MGAAAAGGEPLRRATAAKRRVERTMSNQGPAAGSKRRAQMSLSDVGGARGDLGCLHGRFRPPPSSQNLWGGAGVGDR